MNRYVAIFVSTLAVVLGGGTAHAQTAPSAAEAWQAMTRLDLEAAHTLILENHPGAVAELGDGLFQERLHLGYQTALDRVPYVTNSAGYSAVLSGFATALGDEHITSNHKFRGINYRWAGLIMARRGGAWVVASQYVGKDNLIGARLASCDGETADSVAMARLAFRVSVPIEAQLIAYAGVMFVDDGNPFLNEPETCRFETTSGPVTVNMDWGPVETALLAEALNVTTPGAQAGFGVRHEDGIWWIALERLSDEAATVLDAFEARSGEWRSSEAIVIDLRGNGGGDSRHGRRLADLIYGPGRTAALLRRGSACAALWRASPGNAAHVRASAARSQDPQTSQYYAALAEQIDEATAAGEPFDDALPDCTPEQRPQSDVPASTYEGRVIVITDHACFSSCLLMVRDFRAMGALHVGEATNAATRYMEVREVTLPSGLSTFSILQKVVVGEDADIGPFVPDHVFPGAIHDTPALKTWIGQFITGPKPEGEPDDRDS